MSWKPGDKLLERTSHIAGNAWGGVRTIAKVYKNGNVTFEETGKQQYRPRGEGQLFAAGKTSTWPSAWYVRLTPETKAERDEWLRERQHKRRARDAAEQLGRIASCEPGRIPEGLLDEIEALSDDD